MHTYLVWLRAVNVAGKNSIKMTVLKEALLQAGFLMVNTYIQSGNIVLKSKHSIVEVQQAIREIIHNIFGLDITVFVCTKETLIKARDHNPFIGSDTPNKVFLTFLSEIPDIVLIEKLKTIDHKNEEWYLKDAILYYYLPDGMANSKLNNSYFEQKLKVLATGRNLNTIEKMIALCSI